MRFSQKVYSSLIISFCAWLIIVTFIRCNTTVRPLLNNVVEHREREAKQLGCFCHSLYVPVCTTPHGALVGSHNSNCVAGFIHID